jgi:GNAT superfamily N-acetyltransferase
MLAMKVTTTFRRRLLMCACLIDEAPAPPASPAGLELVLLTNEHLNAYLDLRPDHSAREVEARLRRGCTCFVAYHNGVIVQATWTVTGRAWVDYLRGDLVLAPEDIYEFDGYTRPDYRGQRLFWIRNAYARQYYRERGFRRMTGAVAVENVASLHALECLGYRPIGLYGCWRLGPWQRDWAQAFGDEFLPRLERPECLKHP